MNDDQNTSGPYLPPGTAVRYDGLEEGGPEYGTVVHCWFDDEIGAHDCYVAFFGDKQPMGKANRETVYPALCVNIADGHRYSR
jgi:hypothetical protein